MVQRVIVVGGGNAGLCAALAASEAGATVTVLERAPTAFRGGNSRHTRNIRTMHDRADGFVSGPYSVEEFEADLASVSGEAFNRETARQTITLSEELPAWMWSHGARWQPPIAGTLSLSRTNHFFLGGGKALLNAYYRSAARRGIDVRYDTAVTDFVIRDGVVTGVVAQHPGSDPGVIEADAVVVSAGGFEANKEWLAQVWGDAARNFVVRGTRYNDGAVLRRLHALGARPIGPERGAHAIAVDARAPEYDAGIVSRIDVIPLAVVVNHAAERFSDEGADLWPKRYASWGHLIAGQPGQIAYAIFDAKLHGRTIPSLYPPISAPTLAELAGELGLDPARLEATIAAFNAACPAGCAVTETERDGCATQGIEPQKSNWARPVDSPPYFAFALRPGITFTFLSVAVDGRARVESDFGPYENLFAAGEIMSGNVLSNGYLAGFGMTIGSVWGRIAGYEAARA